MFKLIFLLFVSSVTSKINDELAAVSRFREYLRIDTSKRENFGIAVKFWQIQGLNVGLPVKVYEPNGLPIVVITWKGLDPTLPSIMLNSHMDVVSANEAEWKYPPFSAYIDEKGDIYARGAQDTKDVGMQYIEAIRKLKENGVSLLRTVHVTLMPDEETGGFKGIKSFIKTKEFLDLNVGFVLDEGLASENDTMIAFYQDRRPWQMEFTVYGGGGHGFSMSDENAADKASKLLNKIIEFRNKNIEIMKSHNKFDFGKYTSVNVNTMSGGTAINVIPSNLTIGVDMRLSSEASVDEINALVNSWVKEAGPGTQVIYLRKDDVSKATVLNENNFYWMAMEKAVNKMGYKIAPMVCPATSDMLVLRNLGFPAVGFSTKIFTKSKIHGTDEYLNVQTYLNGINVYYEIIKSVANVPNFL